METFSPTDAEAYRALARTWAASVTVVTARRHTGPYHASRPELDGFTATHFFTVSMQPPILAVSAAKNSGADELLAEVEDFAVNLLSSGQAALATAFAQTQADRGNIFARFPWSPNATGVPLLHDLLGAFSARVRQRVDAGDHTLVLGDITAVHRGERTDPLLFHNRAFRTLGP